MLQGHNLGYFQQLDLLNDVEPTKQHYDYFLFLGTTLEGCIDYLHYLALHWSKGMRFNTLVLLSGQRSLDPRIESLKQVFNNVHLTQAEKDIIVAHWSEVKTEVDMMQLVFSSMTIIEPIRVHTHLIVVNASNKLKPDGSFARPTTCDTIESWLALNPSAGTCVAITSQPHILYAQSVLATCLPESFPVTTIGPAITEYKYLMRLLAFCTRKIYAVTRESD